MGVFEMIIAAVFALAGIAVGVPWGRIRGREKGKQEAQDGANRRTLEALEEGRKAVDHGRAGGGDPDERVRSNDGQWR